MSFFASLKQNHISALESLSDRKVEWRLVVALLFVMAATLILLYVNPVFGFVEMLEPVLSKLKEVSTTDPSFGFIALVLFFSDVLAELFGVLMWSYITVRVLKYLKKALPFKQVVNIYLVVLLYEMILGFAVLSATAIASNASNVQSQSIEEMGSGREVLLFVIAAYLVWLYIWSIRYAMNNRKHVMSSQSINNQ